MKNSSEDYGKKVKEKYPGAEYYEFDSQFRSDLEVHDQFTVEWDGNEAMLISKTYDSVSKQTKSGITDGDAATMIIERSARVVGQMPDGEVMAAGKRDKGKALFMDILRQKWIYPNANAQRPFLDKLRLWEMYSGVYGEMPMYYDWDVSPTGYTGPNCWLWNPRNFIPQQGRYSIADMDYVHAISYMSYKEIENELENIEKKPGYAEDSGWIKENLEVLLEMAKNSSKSIDSNRDSFVERQRNKSDVKDRVQIVTRYEAGDDGRWTTFSPMYACLKLRSIPNPHKSGKIPFVIKPGIPLMDSFYNLAELSRAKPVQFAKDGLTNFYFQGIKMNIYPPTVVNANGIVPHTVSNEPGAIWEEVLPNSARRLETSNAGLATYQAAMGQMNGALQNIFGTTTTQINADQAMNPTFGKTPEALKYQQGRESARDNQNRAYLQSAIEELMDGMMGLIPVMGAEDIPIDLFNEDIQAIRQAGYDDIDEIFKNIVPNESLTTGRLMLNPKKLAGVEYRFNMKADSTIKADKQEQRQNLKDVMDTLATSANILQVVQETTGKVPNYEQLLNSYAALADLPGIENLFIDAPQPQDPSEHPVVKLIEMLKIDFNSLPEDSKQEILAMIGAPSRMPSPAQQELELKAAQAHTTAVGQGMTAAKTAHDMEMQKLEALLSAGSQESQPTSTPESSPKVVNSTVFQDPTIAALAEDLHKQR